MSLRYLMKDKQVDFFDPLKMSLEMAHKVIVPQKKNYVPQFLKQRYINSYYMCYDHA